jgi:hypothetical protein
MRSVHQPNTQTAPYGCSPLFASLVVKLLSINKSYCVFCYYRRVAYAHAGRPG